MHGRVSVDYRAVSHTSFLRNPKSVFNNHVEVVHPKQIPGIREPLRVKATHK